MSPDEINIINFIAESHILEFQMYIRGHLYLEALLGEMIQRKDSNIKPKTIDTFHKKIIIAEKLMLIDNSEKDLLNSYNQVRNKIAHDFKFKFDFDIFFDLAQKAGIAGVDFSDETIYENKELSQDWYDISGIINEVVVNTFFHLVYRNQELFPDDDVHRFLC